MLTSGLNVLTLLGGQMSWWPVYMLRCWYFISQYSEVSLTLPVQSVKLASPLTCDIWSNIARTGVHVVQLVVDGEVRVESSADETAVEVVAGDKGQDDGLVWPSSVLEDKINLAIRGNPLIIKKFNLA